MFRPTGSTNGAPASRASAAICWETVEVVTPVSSATARIEPSRDSSTRSRSRRTFMGTSFTIAERYVQQGHVDTDGRGRVEWVHGPPRHPGLTGAGRAIRRRRRHLDGDRLDAVRPAR